MALTKLLKSFWWSAVWLPALLPVTLFADPAPAHNFEKWEKAVSVFERHDATNPPPKGAILFIGSSTIARWKSLAQDFPDYPVLNRGFGGSEIVDSTHFAPRLIFACEPKTVLLRAGGNDLWAGKSAEQVFQDYQAFVETVHKQLPQSQIIYVSLSPSIARWAQRDKERALNTAVADYNQGKNFLRYIETYDLPLGTNGLPRPELFVKDGLHFNADGYQLLAARVRPFLRQ